MIQDLYVRKLHLSVAGFFTCISYINILNRAINRLVLEAIVVKHGKLPVIILPPVLVVISYILHPL